MEADLIALLACIPGGAIGFFLGHWWARHGLPVPQIITQVLPVASDHAHEWHVRGKVNGRVKRYCVHCDATWVGN